MKIVDKVKEEILIDLEVNFKNKLKQTVIGGFIYSTKSNNLIDLIGLVALDVDSNVGVYNLSANKNELKFHTKVEVKSILNTIKDKHTQIKTDHYLLVLDINSKTEDTDVDYLLNLNITLD